MTGERTSDTDGRDRADARIAEAVGAWPGVTAGLGRRGEFAFTVGDREIGHLHEDRVAHFGFPKRLWAELMEAGRVTAHPLDRPGFAARRLDGDADVDVAIELMRLNYDRAVAARGVPPDA